MSAPMTAADALELTDDLIWEPETGRLWRDVAADLAVKLAATERRVDDIIKEHSASLRGATEFLLRGRLDRAEAALVAAQKALFDMREGWRYIRDHHGDLYGVGWDRAQNKADAALATIAALPIPAAKPPEGE